MACVFVGVGSNLGHRAHTIRRAFCALREVGGDFRFSRAYRTKPYGVVNQPCFINMVVQFETLLGPHALLQRLLHIEETLGRERTQRWGPRTIDLDILFYDDVVITDKVLTIPHPDIQRRLFVLRPFLDIAPNFFHPVMKTTIRDLYDELIRAADLAP